MTEMENAYAAGLFDGEGSVMLTRIHKRDKFRRPTVSVANTSRSLLVSVANTSRSLLEFLKITYGGWISEKKKRKKANHSKSWHWKLTQRQAIEFLRCIVPYLREPEKLRRTSLIINGYVGFTNNGGHYTEDTEKAKLALEAEFFRNSTKRSFLGILQR